MLERYADLAAIASVDTRQLKVIRQLESTRVTGTAVEKDQENLPTFVSIDYMKNFIPLGPAEPGMRLLKSVTISTKVSVIIVSVYFLVYYRIWPQYHVRVTPTPNPYKFGVNRPSAYTHHGHIPKTETC